MRIILLSIVDNSENNLGTIYFVHSDQTSYFKIGKFCLFMSYNLSVKWPVRQ